jgi:hypothetical protein
LAASYAAAELPNRVRRIYPSHILAILAWRVIS